MTDAAEHILDEATDWLLRISERPDDRAVQAALEQWLAIDQRHAETWRDLNHSYDLIGATGPALADRWQTDEAPVRSQRWLRRQAAGRRNIAIVRQPKRKSVRRTRGAVAAAVAAAIAVWAGPSAMIALRAEYQTGTGELEKVRLADGSVAQLGPGSAIRIRYEANERRVELLAGQALFEVRSDKTRPFRVMAGAVTTTVLGTAFDVRRVPSATEIGVQHGRVRVESGKLANGPVILGAGDHVAVNDSGDADRSHGSPLLVAAWVHGEVNARDRTVTQVIDDIRPWYKGRIFLMDETMAGKRVNGVFNPRDPARAIRSMVAPLGGKVTEITPWIILVRG